MSLIAWWPLSDSTLNNLVDPSNPLQSGLAYNAARGKIGAYSFYNPAQSNSGGLKSTKEVDLGPTQSMFCWVYLTEYSWLSGVITNHHHDSPTGMGLTMNDAGNICVNTSSTVSCDGCSEANHGFRTYYVYRSEGVVPKNQWCHIGYTFNNGVLSFYINGVQQKVVFNGTNTNQYEYTNVHLKYMRFGKATINVFGWSTVFSEYGLKGNLCDARVYDHALSKKEVKELSRALMVHYNFNSRPIDYLEFTGTQFISTGVVGPAVWEFDMQWTVTGTRQLQGYGPSLDEYWGVQVSGNYGLFDGDSTIKAGNRDFITHDYETGRILINGNLARTTGTAAASGKTYGLGDLGAGGGWGCTFKLYRCRCIQNGILVRDFIPWEQSGVKGLKDTKSGTFYTNSGSGTFGGMISNSNHNLINNAGYNYSGVSKGASLTYDTACGLYSMACTGSWYGWGNTSASTGASWNDAVYVQTDLGGRIIPTEFTVSWWFKYHSNNYSSWINLSGDSNNGESYDKNQSTLSDYDGTWKLGGTSLNSTSNINTSGWHHYAITAKNGGQAKLYRDGALVQSNTLTTELGPLQYILLGCGYAGGVVRPTRGLFGDFKLFMTELSDVDIKELYNVGWAANRQGQIFSYVANEGQPKFQITRGGVNNCSEIIEHPNLPSGYTALDKIWLGPGDRIATYYTPNQNTGIDIEFELTDTANDKIYVFGAGGTNYTDRAFELYPYSGDFDCNFGNNSVNIGTLVLNKKIRFIRQQNKVTMYINGAKYTAENTMNNFTCPNILYLGILNRNSTALSKVTFPIYRCVITESGQLIRYYIPCINSSGQRGMYELVTKQFTVLSSANSVPLQSTVQTHCSGTIYCDEFNEI